MRYYLHVLNYKDKSYINIGLNEEQSNKYEMYEDINDFIMHEGIDKKYGFIVGESAIMIAQENTIYYK